MMQSKTNLLSLFMIAYNEETFKTAKKTEGVIPVTFDKTSAFFENDHILKWHDHFSDSLDRSKYAGLVSPAFFSKAANGRATIASIEKALSTPENVRVAYAEWREREVDVLLFSNGYRYGLNIIKQGDNFHGPDFSKLTQEIFDLAGMDWDVENKLIYPVFSNYWIAKPELIDKYVNTFLRPCMDVMKTSKDLQERLWADSKYRKKLPEQAVKDIGVNYYPLHAFICERFFSVFLQKESIENPQLTIKFYK